jgi:mycothiol synthase
MTRPAVESRSWTSVDDSSRIRVLASRRLAHDWPAPRLHPGDLEWWTVQTWGREPGLPDRVRVWSSGSEALAFAWYTPPGDLDLVLDPTASAEAGAIVTEALAWGTRQRDRFAPDAEEPVQVWATDAASLETAALSALGLEPRSGADPFAQLTGALDPDAVRPGPPRSDGIAIRPISDADVEARVTCSRAAFTRSTMTPERYRQTFRCPTYRPELDLVALDGTGGVAAFALGWYDPATGIVELEPVGVHPDRQRRGIGLAVCRAVIDRARQLGAARVMISTNESNRPAIGLYRRLGLTPTTRIVAYATVPEIGRPT